jgi:hypothetical protein
MWPQAMRMTLPPFVVAKVVAIAFALLAVPSVSGAFLHWDASHYLYIAANGYPHSLDFHDGFLPGYPLLIRVVEVFIDDPIWTALIVSAAGQLLALLWIARLLVLENVMSSSARLWVYALFPAAVFLGLPYSEGPFIAATAASIYFARAGHLERSSLAAAIACMIRPFGIALVVLLLAEIVMRPEWRSRRAAWIALVPLPLVAFSAFMGLWTGDWLAYFHAQGGPTFGTYLAVPWHGAIAEWHALLNSATARDMRIFYTLTLVATTAALALVTWAWVHRDFPRSLAAYCTAALILTLTISTWRSTMRYELALFPLLLLLPRSTRWQIPLLTLCIGGFALSAFHFAQGFWLG